MQTAVQRVAVSKKSVWAGRVLSAIPALMLLFGGVVKLLQLPSVVQGFAQYGYPASSLPIVGILEVASTIVYLIPRTAVLGAILMTGVLGGAIASNVRIADPAFAAPLVLGVLVWGGLYLRDQRLRALIPLREQATQPQ
ncbi:MAG: DoxX family protein [Chlamydiota bacterium]